MMYILVLKLLCYLAHIGSIKNALLPGYKNTTLAQFAEKVLKAINLQRMLPVDNPTSQEAMLAHLQPDDEKLLDLTI